MPVIPEYDQAVEFLYRLRPNGPHILAAIPIGSGHLVSQYFASTEGVAEWCESMNPGHGIYYHVGLPREGVTERLSKDKVGAVDHVWVDIDPTTGAPLKEAQAAILDRLLSAPPSGVPSLPNYIVNSGNGFQAIWKLAEPVLLTDADAISRVESVTRHLVRVFDGDRQAWNVDRLLRLPGTINYPNARKMKDGRQAALAKFREVHTKPVSIADFTQAPALKRLDDLVEIDVKGPVLSYTTETLPGELGDKWKDLVTHCQNSWHFKDMGYASRSEAVLGAVRYMLERGMEHQVIYDILMSRALAISEHVYDQKDTHRYAKRQIGQAKRSMDADKPTALAGIDPESAKSLTFIFSDPATDKNGNPKGPPKIIPQLIHNCIVAVHKLGVKCTYNAMADLMLVDGEPFEDHVITRIRTDAESRFKVTFSQPLMKDVLQSLCKENPYHPVEDYLETLPEWDRRPRIDTWLIDYCGAEDTEFNRAVGRIILIAAVRRIRQPGCKFDEMLILEGAQGDGKSMLLGQGLVPDPSWFNDHLTMDKGPKEFMEDTQGHWIIECSELVSMRRAKVEQLKALLARQTDRARMAYARSRTDRPRRFVIFGSTNQEQYLVDDTGNRRFWPVRTSGKLHERVKALASNRDQIWAEAAHFEAAGESIRLSPRLYDEATEIQASRKVDNIYLEPIQLAVGSADGVVHIHHLMEHIGVPLSNRHLVQHRVSDALRELGFTRRQIRKDGLRFRAWIRGEEFSDIIFRFDASGEELKQEVPDDAHPDDDHEGANDEQNEDSVDHKDHF